jgi:hypothetical protein
MKLSSDLGRDGSRTLVKDVDDARFGRDQLTMMYGMGLVGVIVVVLVKSRPTVTPFSRAMLTPLELGRWFFLLAVGAYPRSA